MIGYGALIGHGALGAAELPAPSGFRWPSDADYTSALVTAVHGMSGDVGRAQSSGIISPPMQTQLVALRATIEAATGLPFSEVVGLVQDAAALSSAQTPAQVAAAIGDLIGSGLSVAADTLKALAVAAEVVEVIPIVGQVVAAVFSILVAIFSAPSRADLVLECERTLYQTELDQMCQRLARESTDIASTGYDPVIGGVFRSPADMFRPLAYRYWEGSRAYPANVSSLMLMMCGGAAGPFGMAEERYDELVGRVRAGYVRVGPATTSIPKNPKAGIPYGVRKKLWKLLEAVMTCVQDPNDPSPIRKADQGRAAMPIVLDILRTAEDRGQIDKTLTTFLCQDALDWTSRKRVCKRENLGLPEIAAYGSCRPQLVPQMISQYEDMMREFRVRLFNEFADPRSPDPQNPRLLATPARDIVGAVIDLPDQQAVAKVPTPSGKLSYLPTLKFGPGIVSGMHDALADIRNAQSQSTMALVAKLLLASAAGYGAYTIGRRQRWLSR